MSQREHIMFSQTLHISYLETACLCCSQRTVDWQQFPVRKHIVIDKACFRFHRIEGITCNSMIQEDPAWAQQLPGLLEIGRQQCFSNMLEHSHADNFVKRVSFSDLSIIANLDLTIS